MIHFMNSVVNRWQFVRPSPESCCHNCAKVGKYLLEVCINGQWWHFKCANTTVEAKSWMRWRSDDGSKVRMKLNLKEKQP